MLSGSGHGGQTSPSQFDVSWTCNPHVNNPVQQNTPGKRIVAVSGLQACNGPGRGWVPQRVVVQVQRLTGPTWITVDQGDTGPVSTETAQTTALEDCTGSGQHLFRGVIIGYANHPADEVGKYTIEEISAQAITVNCNL